MQKISLVAVIAFLAACKQGQPESTGAVPRLSHDTLDRFAACQRKVAVAAPSRQPGKLETYADLDRRSEAESRALTDEVARSCGFASRAQLDRVKFRYVVALGDLKDLELAREYPDGTFSALLAKNEAQWREEVARGEATEEDIVRRRENFREVEAHVAKAQERTKRRAASPPKTLDASGPVDLWAEEAGPASAAEIQRITAEALTQPPLSADELEAVRTWKAP